MTDWEKIELAERLRALESQIGRKPMSAPTITNLHRLRDLQENWDGHGGAAIEQRALDAAYIFVTTGGHAVPCSTGGVQLEWHTDGWDIEIEFTPEGKIKGVLVAREA